jgi:hypothetical protein
MNDRSPYMLALRALRDCRVIRARFTHPGYRQLWANYEAEFVGGDRFSRGDHGNFRLTERGLAAAALLKPLEQEA